LFLIAAKVNKIFVCAKKEPAFFKADPLI